MHAQLPLWDELWWDDGLYHSQPVLDGTLEPQLQSDVSGCCCYSSTSSTRLQGWAARPNNQRLQCVAPRNTLAAVAGAAAVLQVIGGTLQLESAKEHLWDHCCSGFALCLIIAAACLPVTLTFVPPSSGSHTASAGLCPELDCRQCVRLHLPVERQERDLREWRCGVM